jgi:SAM-dependent methyltransferase
VINEPPTPSVFDAERAQELSEADVSHWWFRAKARLVAALARRWLRSTPRERRFVDLGAGAGGVTSRLRRALGESTIVEGSAVLAKTARDRYSMSVIVATTDDPPIRDASVDVVTLLDVIEHLDDPHDTLRAARRILRPGGLLLITVPAHPRLWSRADDLLGHNKRRYTRSSVAEQVCLAGFEIVRTTHVFSWLVIPVWLTRRRSAGAEAQLGLQQRSPFVSAVGRILTEVEMAVTRVLSLPMGTSIVCVAERGQDGS